MRFTPTPIAGAVVVDMEPVEDERGAFARLFCPRAFAAAGHPFSPAQTSLSRNTAAFTLRGLHFQAAPFDEGWNDPAFGIQWPAEPRVMSERDSAYPDFSAA